MANWPVFCACRCLRSSFRPDGIAELTDAAIIREVHVYGPVVEIGVKVNRTAQHSGLGTKLIKAANFDTRAGYRRFAVISAIGTREYYRKAWLELANLTCSRHAINTDESRSSQSERLNQCYGELP